MLQGGTIGHDSLNLADGPLLGYSASIAASLGFGLPYASRRALPLREGGELRLTGDGIEVAR